MARRAEAKALELSAKNKGEVVANVAIAFNDSLFTERYFLMFWAAEEKVSVHKENELKGHDSQHSFIVGDTASCCFGKNYYEGKISGVGKKAQCVFALCCNNEGNRADMLALENDFIQGKYIDFCIHYSLENAYLGGTL